MPRSPLWRNPAGRAEKLEGVSKRLKGFTLEEGSSPSIERGKVVLGIGENAFGKPTEFRILPPMEERKERGLLLTDAAAGWVERHGEGGLSALWNMGAKVRLYRSLFSHGGYVEAFILTALAFGYDRMKEFGEGLRPRGTLRFYAGRIKEAVEGALLFTVLAGGNPPKASQAQHRVPLAGHLWDGKERGVWVAGEPLPDWDTGIPLVEGLTMNVGFPSFGSETILVEEQARAIAEAVWMAEGLSAVAFGLPLCHLTKEDRRALAASSFKAVGLQLLLDRWASLREGDYQRVKGLWEKAYESGASERRKEELREKENYSAASALSGAQHLVGNFIFLDSEGKLFLISQTRFVVRAVAFLQHHALELFAFYQPAKVEGEGFSHSFASLDPQPPTLPFLPYKILGKALVDVNDKGEREYWSVTYQYSHILPTRVWPLSSQFLSYPPSGRKGGKAESFTLTVVEVISNVRAREEYAAAFSGDLLPHIASGDSSGSTP